MPDNPEPRKTNTQNINPHNPTAMKNLSRSLLAIGLAATCTPVFANTEPDDSLPAGNDATNPISFARTTPEVAKIIKEGQAPDPQSIPAPDFVVKTKNNNFIFTIGGEINPILGYDIGNNLYSQSGISFVTADIPVPAQTGKKGDFYINPLNGFIYTQITGLAGTKNEISGFIKLGTNGINNNLALQRAYLKWRNFTGGMKLTLMQDCYACQPPTIDPEGPSGCISTVSNELAYNSPDYKGFRWAVALDMPTYYSSQGYYRGKDYPTFDGKQTDQPYGDAEQLIPDIPAWAEYTFSPNNRIRVSGLLRNFAYRDLLANKTRHMVGWGAMLSGNVSPVKPLIFYYQLAYGKGIGNYLQDIAGKPLSFIPDDKHPGKMYAAPMMGANIGVTYNISPKWQVNAMFSESRIWKVGDYANALPEADNYKYALYGAANCFYNITSYLQAGIEYLWGHRETWNIGGANDSRIQTQLAFTF